MLEVEKARKQADSGKERRREKAVYWCRPCANGDGERATEKLVALPSLTYIACHARVCDRAINLLQSVSVAGSRSWPPDAWQGRAQPTLLVRIGTSRLGVLGFDALHESTAEGRGSSGFSRQPTLPGKRRGCASASGFVAVDPWQPSKGPLPRL